MEAIPSTPRAIEFGRFRVLPHRRALLADGRPLDLGGRAFDVLMVLIEASGAVVSKDALMNRVWPDRIIEENSLQHQISTLRRVFAADRDLIRTIAGRGYQFTGEIRTVAATPNAPASAGMAQATPTPFRPPTNLPEPVSELIGRDAELDEILNLSASHRLVTLTGAGGIGKTRLGFEAARHLLPRFADGVWGIELAPLSDPELVPVTVATALGLELASGTASPLSVANALRAKQLMLVLDNCEHVVDAAARTAEALLRANPGARVIATSREPLRAEGERIYPVPPLAVPTESSPDSEDPLQYGAVRLFVERARAAAPHFSSDARAAAAIAGICRRLDGIPLAIELAAARAAALGIEGLAARLHDRFRLLAGGHRTVMPRQQTLRATLDWSYELLPESERVILRRLAVLAGLFSLEAAGAVTAGPGVAPSEVADGVSRLVAKSLVAAEIDGAIARYRLLDTTRAYALEKLGDSGELEAIARHHAEYCRDLFERAEAEWEARPAAEWLAEYGRQIDNLRAALDWAFSPGGDASIGVALTAAAVPLWLQLSAVEESRRRVEQAIAGRSSGAASDSRRDMQLQAARGAALLFTKGPMRETEAAWAKALELAEGLGDTEYQLRALWGLWVHRMNSGEFGIALALAQQFHRLAARRTDPADLPIADRMIGVSLHYRGDQTAARHHIDRMLTRYVAPVQRSSSIRFLFDQKVVACVALARILWLQGFPDQAWRIAQRTVDDARALDNPVTLCFALAEAGCPVALFTGDHATAEHYVRMLLDSAAAHALPIWQSWGHRFRGTLLIRQGALETGLALLQTSLDRLPDASFQPRFTWFLGQLADGSGGAGQVVNGLAAIDEALARSERNEDRWCLPELLRIKGGLLQLQGMAGAVAAAEGHFRQALDWARRQGVLSWELRAATSLARLLSDQGRSADATALLQPAYDRFTEGFATADLKAAKALLDDLS